MRLVWDNDSAFFLALERFGYDITDQAAAVRAFQRRWRPKRIDGVVDGELGALEIRPRQARTRRQDQQIH